MTTSDVTIGLAFIAGLISFVSPCVLPLVPAYIGYMGGRVTQQVSRAVPGVARRPTFTQRFGTLTHGVFFVLGFTIFFVLFGLLTTAAVSSLTSLGVTENEVRDGIARVGGAAVILFGLHIMGFLNRFFAWAVKQAARLDQNPYGNMISVFIGLALIGLTYWLFVESWFLTLLAVLLFTQVFNDSLKADTPGAFWTSVIQRIQTAFYVDTRRQNQPQSRYGYLGSLFMGVVFSAGWTPCIGPIYGTVLTMANTGGSMSEAGTLLAAYSLGLGIPFLLTALALDQAQGALRRLQKNMRLIEAFSGVFLVVIGVLVFSGQLQRLSNLGSGDGTLGTLSSNLESCTIGATEGRIHWGNWLDCVREDGLKEDFYVASPKPALVVEMPASSDAAVSAPALDAGGEAVTEALSVPSLDAGPTGDESPELPALDNVRVGLRVGERAPDFSAQTPDGTSVRLSDYRGRVVLVNFWATWCPPCRNEMPDFQTIYNIYGPDDFVVLAVNNQERSEDVRAFIEDFGITFPVVLDESGAINDGLYGDIIQAYPISLLLDEDGVIVHYFPGELKGPQLINALGDLLGS
jgi:cytochrome c-type biogenesis protein